MSKKKVVSRTMAIALGIICIVLAVGLAGAFADYTSIISGKNSTITTIENQKNQLQTCLNGNATLLNRTQTWLNGNETLLSKTQTWLSGNESALHAASIDVYTQRGGKGTDNSGGVFLIPSNEPVSIYAEVTNASNMPQVGCSVTYEIHWPASGPMNGSIYATGTEVTNASGIADIMQIPLTSVQIQGRNPLGTWLVYVTTSINNQSLSDAMTFLITLLA